MTDQLQRYYSYKVIVQRLLLFSGLWPTANPSILYRLVPFVHSLGCGMTSCAILNFCIQNFANLDIFFKGLMLAFSYWVVLQKTFCLIVYRKRLIDVHASLDRTFDNDLNDSKLRPILLSPLHLFRSPTYALIIATYMGHSIIWITPLVAIATQYFLRVDTIKYILPYPTVYPWSINSWRYPLHYIFELYAGFTLGAFSSSIDALFAYYVFQICGQLRTLSHRLTSVRSNEDYHKVIRECVDKLQILTRCRNHLERIYGPVVLCMLIVSAMIMCALIYQAVHMSPGKAVLVIVYIIMKSMQTLFYGAFGSFLTAESDSLRQSIYASDWAGSGEKCLMTDVLIMITYNPSPLKACSLSTISVDMFVAMCNTAFSYFFMIRTLEEGNGV